MRIERESWRTPCVGKSHLLPSGHSRRPCVPCPPCFTGRFCPAVPHPTPPPTPHTHQACRSFKAPLLRRKTSPEGLINGSHDSRRQLAPRRLLRRRAGSLTCWPCRAVGQTSKLCHPVHLRPWVPSPSLALCLAHRLQNWSCHEPPKTKDPHFPAKELSKSLERPPTPACTGAALQPGRGWEIS